MRVARAKVIACSSPDECYDAICDQVRQSFDRERGFTIDFHPSKEVNGLHLNYAKIRSVETKEDVGAVIIGDYSNQLEGCDLLTLSIPERD